MGPSLALQELEYALLPTEEASTGRRGFRGRRRVVDRAALDRRGLQGIRNAQELDLPKAKERREIPR